MSIALQGLSAIKRALGEVGQAHSAAAGGALYLEASRIMAKSVPLVPVDLGGLKGSQFVSAPKVTAFGLTVQMGYGKDYAVPVHERHPTKKKFLRIPFDDEKPRAAKNIAADLGRLFRERKGFGNINHPFPTKPKA